ncbi:hypothetical protein EW146_g3389, partial [Bondarzewia mesenterica]
QPLIPTTTGFTGFFPTRASPFQQQQQQPSFLTAQPTGFAQPLFSQQTGFPTSGPLLSQPTGAPGAGQFGAFGSAPLLPPSYQNTSGSFGQIQPRLTTMHTGPTGFNPGFGQSFNNGMQQPPSAAPQSKDTTPANIFAQMKAGTFANDSAPQSSDKYDALRVNPSPLTAQPTGWGYPGFPGGYGGYQ